MAGRKPLPQEIKALKGTLRQHRVNKDAPQPLEGEMLCPENLPQDAVKHFHNLKFKVEALGLSSPTYTEALCLAAMRMGQIEKLNISLLAEGYVIETMDNKGNESMKANPAYSMLSDAMRHLQSLLADFGMNPSSIQKVGAKGKQQDNPFEAFQ
ncbi:P27 family phage terminase small subunit [Desulfovibrio sp. OttesenSCG-928-A18]|nr:P27 family phage terminase small subunit [Desulfovibrio sp. OttesenSCG-928-A18]